MTKEVFKPVPNADGYFISNKGNLKSSRCNKGKVTRLLSPCKDRHGYLHCCIKFNDGKYRNAYIHQLVIMAFINNNYKEQKLVADHIDNNPLNNNLENLQVVTKRENSSKDKKGYTSKYVGVLWAKQVNRWYAKFYYKGRREHLGSFKNEKVAAAVYQLRLEQHLKQENR